MAQKSIDELKEIIGSNWPKRSDEKTRSYIGKFFDRSRNEQKIIAKVEGNHGTYTVSIEIRGKETDSACSCYIGKDGDCHHCHALALTFLKDPESFSVVQKKKLSSIRTLEDLEKYLERTKLDTLLQELKSNGITNKDFAEAMGMNLRHLSSTHQRKETDSTMNLEQQSWPVCG